MYMTAVLGGSARYTFTLPLEMTLTGHLREDMRCKSLSIKSIRHTNESTLQDLDFKIALNS